MKRKILTLLLALALVLTMLPMTALAADGDVAEVNGQGYSTLQAAIGAANSGDTVRLLTDVETKNGSDTKLARIVISKPITLDLNDKKIISPDDMGNNNTNFAALYVAADTTINATAAGGIDTGTNGGYGINVIDGATLTVNGGTYYGGGTAIQVQKGTLVINDGYFSCEPYGEPYGYKFLINCVDAAWKDGSAKITIKGGSFERFDPADSASENPHGNFVASGYLAVKGGTEEVPVWTVEDHRVAVVNNDVGYTTLNDAYAAANDGDTITLLKDVQLSSYIEVKKDITLDLGGKKLSRDGRMLLDIYSTMTIQNGEIEMPNADGTAAIWVNQAANLTFERDASVTVSSNCFGIAYDASCTTAEVTLKGTLKGGSGITMNGNIGEGTSNKLTVDGATIDVESHGIYQAGCAETNFSITDSTISGTTGIEVRAGKLTISNSKVSSTGVFAVEPNSNGATTDGAAIAIAQHTTKHPIDVTISGGEFSGEYAIYESNPQKNDADSIAKVNLTVNGGKFAGKIYSEDLTKFIYAGYFTEIPAESYIAPGKAVYLSNLAGYDYMVATKEAVTPVTPSEPASDSFNLNAGMNSVKFADVSDNAWYAAAVNYAVDKGLMNGTGEDKFSPEADTTRGMIVTILARLDGKNTSGTPWYQAGQRWAMEYEISDGTNMTSAITREQLVTMLFRYAVKNGLDAVTLSENLSRFTDASSVSAWAVPAMQWAVGQGLIQGSNGLLRPQSNASRAEVATILMRFCELLGK